MYNLTIVINLLFNPNTALFFSYSYKISCLQHRFPSPSILIVLAVNGVYLPPNLLLVSLQTVGNTLVAHSQLHSIGNQHQPSFALPSRGPIDPKLKSVNKLIELSPMVLLSLADLKVKFWCPHLQELFFVARSAFPEST